MTKFNYFYKVENLINGNFYYGVHKTSNLEDGYMGSGNRIQYALKKYGRENFKKEILLSFDTYKEALDYESEIVNEQLLMDPSCYNLALGGKSDTGFFRKGPALINKDTKELIKPNTIEEFNELFKSGNYFGHTKGKTIFKSEDGKIYCLSVLDKKIKELNLHGLHYNKIFSKDKDGNVYWVEKTDERLQSKELIPFWTNRKHKEETKQKIGLKNSIKQKGEKNSQYGTCWIYNDIKSIKIKTTELQIFLAKGWFKGRKIKFGEQSVTVTSSSAKRRDR